MIVKRPANERGHMDHGWLDTYHTFSFGAYRDPAHMGFRSLRVINEDRVLPAQGFGTHPHNDMEILTWVLDGALEHKDSMGTGSVIRPGEIQKMTAGTGVTHSEFNHSSEEPVHFLQIWLLPEAAGIEPSYDQTKFEDADLRNQLRPIAGRSPANGAVHVNQDAHVLAGRLDEGSTVTHALADDRHAWVQVARGSVTLNGVELSAGDGAAVSDETALEIAAQAESEVLVFDLA